MVEIAQFIFVVFLHKSILEKRRKELGKNSAALMLLPLLQEKLVADRIEEIVLTPKDLLIDASVEPLDLRLETSNVLVSSHSIFKKLFC